jgi:hypothetical protein
VPTFDFEYHPEAGVPWALTRNKGFWQEDETLDTLLYIDGLKRVVQTKMEAEVLQGDEKVYGLSVSGKVEFDALGRTVAQGQPLFESGYQTPFVWQMTPKNPTRFTYKARKVSQGSEGVTRLGRCHKARKVSGLHI